jgi:hypothetical protein
LPVSDHDKIGGEIEINTKLLAGLAVFVLLMGIGSFAFGHAADAQTSTPAKKVLNKVEKQRENRDKAFGHANWTKKNSIVK